MKPFTALFTACCLAVLQQSIVAAQDKADAAPAAVWRTYEFQVRSKQDAPVVGAVISPWQIAYGLGSMRLGDALEAPLKTDAAGKFELVIPKDAVFIPTVEQHGVRSFAFHVEHPDYPTWSDYVPVQGDRKIVLADSATIQIKVHPVEGNGTPRDLFPTPTTTDWSEKGGVVTIRRVDLASKGAFRWLRIVQAPETGPQNFTDLIDLSQLPGPTISLEAALKPGVRVEGQLADNAP